MRKRAIPLLLLAIAAWFWNLYRWKGCWQSGIVCEGVIAGSRIPLDVRLSALLALFSALIGLSMVAVDFTRWVKARKP